MLFRRILFPTDFSKACDDKTDDVAQLARALKTSLILLHVLDERALHELQKRVRKKDDFQFEQDVMVESAEKTIQELASRLAGDLEVTTRVVVGLPYAEICQAAESEDVDLVILPTHGAGKSTHEYQGTTARNVIDLCGRPVMLFKRTDRA